MINEHINEENNEEEVFGGIFIPTNEDYEDELSIMGADVGYHHDNDFNDANY